MYFIRIIIIDGHSGFRSNDCTGHGRRRRGGWASGTDKSLILRGTDGRADGRRTRVKESVLQQIIIIIFQLNSTAIVIVKLIKHGQNGDQ